MPSKKPAQQKDLEKLGKLVDLAEEAEHLLRKEEERHFDEQADKRKKQPTMEGVLIHEPETEIGQRLKQARDAAGLTQGELSEKTRLADTAKEGISRVVLSLYERGVNRPGLREVRLLSEVLRITPNFLIFGYDDPFGKEMEWERYGGLTRSEPEFFAYLTYCFTRLHHHHRLAMMQLMMGLLRGWNKDFDGELDTKANQRFLELADKLRIVISRREKLPPTPSHTPKKK